MEHIEPPEAPRLLQEVRDAFAALDAPGPRSWAVFRCARALYAVRHARAYRSERCQTFAVFCAQLAEEQRGFRCSSMDSYIRVYHAFAHDPSLLKEANVSLFTLVEIAKAPPAHYAELLAFAATASGSAVKARVQALQADRRHVPRTEDQAAPPEPTSAPPPRRPRPRPGRVCRAVPAPLIDSGAAPNPFEACGATMVVLLDELFKLARDLYDCEPGQRTPDEPLLMRHYNQVFARYSPAAEELMDALAPGAARAAAALRARQSGPPPLTIEQMLPLPRLLLDAPEEQLDAQVPLQGHVTYDAHDPLPEPLPRPRRYEQLLFRAIGVMETLLRLLPRAWKLLAQHLAGTDEAFFYQIHEALKAPLVRLRCLVARSQPGIEASRDRVREAEAHHAAVREAIERNLVVLGENHIPEQYVIIGRTRDGRYVAISLYTPQIIATLGSQGWGKSHLAVLLAEACLLRIPGVCRMPAPPRVIWLSADWQQGFGNHQALAGYSPNPYADQRRVLREQYLVQGAHAYEGGTLLCLPHSLPRLTALYGDLIDRGLRVVPVRIHVRELGRFGLGKFLKLGARGSGTGRNKAEEFVDSLIAVQGDDISLPRLRGQIERAKLDRRSREALLQQLTFLATITSEEEHLIDHLEDDSGPLTILLESANLARETILEMESTMMNVLGRPLRSGADPMRLFIVDEFSKRGAKGKSGEFYKEGAAEARHRPSSAYYSGQLVSDLPRGFVGLVMIGGVFNMSSPAEYQRAQRDLRGFAGIDYARISSQPRGVVHLCAARATDPLFTRVAQEVILRPACVHAGGETLTAL